MQATAHRDPPFFDDAGFYTHAHQISSDTDTTFYPYSPHEVKHRKRTTPKQLGRLEGLFHEGQTKPSAHMRVQLARELDMTPRAVQVWFQNRRAKEKKVRSTSSLARRDSAPDITVSQDAPSAESPLQSSPSVPSTSTFSEQTFPPQLHVDTGAASVSPPSSQWAATSPPPASNDSSVHLPQHTFSQYALRRGSVPVNAMRHDPSSGAHFDDYALRRGSVDDSLNRLGRGPYASAAMARNGRVNVARQSRYGLEGALAGDPHLVRHASEDVLGSHHAFSRHQSALSNSMHPFAASANAPLRPPYEPTPGQVPMDNYTFGAPSSTASTTPSPHLQGSSPESEAGIDASDMSRFSSIASGSSFYSDHYNYSCDNGSIVPATSQDHTYNTGAQGPNMLAYDQHQASGNVATVSAPDVASNGDLLGGDSYSHTSAPSLNRGYSMPTPNSHEGPVSDAQPSVNLETYYTAESHQHHVGAPVYQQQVYDNMGYAHEMHGHGSSSSLAGYHQQEISAGHVVQQNGIQPGYDHGVYDVNGVLSSGYTGYT